MLCPIDFWTSFFPYNNTPFNKDKGYRKRMKQFKNSKMSKVKQKVYNFMNHIYLYDSNINNKYELIV